MSLKQLKLIGYWKLDILTFEVKAKSVFVIEYFRFLEIWHISEYVHEKKPRHNRQSLDPQIILMFVLLMGFADKMN